jgi:type I restriction enzyme S subunit
MADQITTIPKGWKMTTLGEVADIKGGKRLPKDKSLVNRKTKHPYIRITDLENNQIKKNQLQFVPDEVFSSISRYIVNSGDVIVSIVGSIGFVAQIDTDLDNASLTENCVKFVNLKNLDSKFLYYFLISKLGQDEIIKNTVGAVQKKLPIYGVQNIQISLSSLPEQRAIAAVLSSLDDKIELLRKQNITLEATAQAIFKEWFVNFNFPGVTDKMIDSELGEIPEGWRVGRLEEIVKNEKNSIVDGPFGTQMKIEEYQESGIPVIEMDYLGDTFITKKFRHFLSNEKFNEVKRSRASAGDIIISKTGTLGLLGILPDDFDKGIIVSRIAKISPSVELNNRLFIYQFLKYLQSKQYWNRISSGSTMPIFNLTHIKEVKVVIPDVDLFTKFETILSPIYKKILNNLLQLQTLSTLRDTLLPKLMKGEVRVAGFNN